MPVRDAAAAAAPGLTETERLVVEAVLADPAKVAFGTVAELAARSGTSGPTVVRVARKLGYSGYRSLQAAVQAELGGSLQPAAERIRRTAAERDDPLERVRWREVANVEATLRAVDPAAFTTAVRLLADRKRRVLVLAGDAERGIAETATDLLGQLRDAVERIDGAPPRVTARIAMVGPADVVVAIDVRRYDAWLVDAVADAGAAGASIVAITDGPLSPLANGSTATFEVVAEGAGPFDSHVGTLALLHALVAAVADRLRGSATARLDRIEETWRRSGVLRDR